MGTDLWCNGSTTGFGSVCRGSNPRRSTYVLFSEHLLGKPRRCSVFYFDMKNEIQPTLLLETSWEVCNKVGGIYTVLSTRAATMVEHHGREHVLFIGPKLEGKQPDFCPSRKKSDRELASALSERCGLPVTVGTWNIIGEPRVALVDFAPLWKEKDTLYFQMWERYGIRGDIGYGDYDESCLFAIAVARVMAALVALQPSEHPVAIFNEWTTGMGLLYLRMTTPEVRNIFITHATSVGRSIAGNGKPLYSQMSNYNGDQMANELGVMCKHQVEKRAAHTADAFGTVSEVTAREAEQLLEKRPDALLYNGFEQGFIPSGHKRAGLRRTGRKAIISLAEKLYGKRLSEEAFIIATSGRSEYRNKGLDIYIDAIRRTATKQPEREVIALILVPSWSGAPRPELMAALKNEEELTMPMQMPYLTHELYDGLDNPTLGHLHALTGSWGEKVYPIFLPAYLDGSDGVLNIKYYDLLPALDLSIFASYYEPWGYTPLESIAFGVPTLTTDKAGFGMWAMKTNDKNCLCFGAKALPREDDNFEELAETIANKVCRFSSFEPEAVSTSKKRAMALAKKASWGNFYPQYLDAYRKAIMQER